MKRLVDKKVHITAVTINQNKNDLHKCVRPAAARAEAQTN